MTFRNKSSIEKKAKAKKVFDFDYNYKPQVPRAII